MEELKIHKCKYCGSDLDYDKAVGGVVRCDYCMRVYTVPRNNTKAKSYLDIGEHGLDTCNFDDAYTAYQKASEIDNQEPEAYFGMALATAQVQYLKDYVNNRMQPIVYAYTEKSFLQDKNFKKALDCATPEQKKEYIAKANEIDRIRRQFYDFKKSGLKYDCFICVKVTEDGGRHTEDSTIASKLYHALQEAGYSPFYSEEEIKGRTGADYEALILYALHCSPSMLLVCTDESYLQTPWVKNEYTRYLNMLNQEEKHRDSLTIVFADTVVEKLPGVNGKIQGVPFKTYDALPRIIDFVDRFVQMSKPELSRKDYSNVSFSKKNVLKQGVTKRKLSSVGQKTITLSDESKLRTAREFLQKGRFSNTIDFCNTLISENPSNSEAYWLIFLAENNCKDEKEFVARLQLNGYDNFEKAIASTANEEDRRHLYYVFAKRIENTLDFDAYKEYIELPESVDSVIAILTDLMFNKAVKEKNETIFNTIIKTVTDVKKYVQMNYDFAQLMSKNNAVIYYKNILNANEGHYEAQWKVFEAENNFSQSAILDYCGDANNHAKLEERLFSYGYNSTAIDGLFGACIAGIKMSAEKSSRLMDFVLSMIPKEKNDVFADVLNKYIKLLFKENNFDLLAKYNNLLLDMNKFDHNAYFNKCLIARKINNPLGLVKYIDNLINDENYILALNLYSEANPDNKNVYLELLDALEEIKGINKAPNCVKYLTDNYYMSKEDIIKRNKDVYQELVNEGKRIYNSTLRKYDCSKKYDVFNLRIDVSKDLGWQDALTFVSMGKTERTNEWIFGRKPFIESNKEVDDLLSDIKDIIENQAEKSRQKVYEDKRVASYIRRDKAKSRFKVSCAIYAGLCCFITVLIAILAMSGVSNAEEFWLVLVDANEPAMYGVSIVFFVIPLTVMLFFITFNLFKKRKIFVVISIILATLCFGVGVIKYGSSKAENTSLYVGDGYVLRLAESNDGYSIKRYGGRLATVNLPSTYNGKPINSIGKNAFKGNKELNYVEIPDSVISIGEGAFSKCSGMTKFDIPSGVISIGDSAFSGCSSLKSIELPIGITSIGNSVFSGCSSLTGIELPIGITSIGESAFSGCSKLIGIKISSIVFDMGNLAFAGCSKLRIYCEMESAPSQWSSNWNPDNRPVSWDYLATSVDDFEYIIDNGTVTITKYIGSDEIVKIPSKINDYPVVAIYDFAFDDCSNVKSVRIPSSVTSIGSGAFNGCSGLISVSIPSGVTSIGKSAFYNCSSLTSIEIPSSVTSIGASAFGNCSSLTAIEIPSGVTSIDASAFYNCSSLTRIEIPSSVTSVGISAFWGCSSLTSIKIPSAVTTMGSNAFLDCDKLTIYCEMAKQPSGWNSNWNPDNRPVKWDYLEANTADFEYIIDGGEVTITKYKGKDTVVSIPSMIKDNPVKAIGPSTFYDCYSLTSIEIPSSVTSIGDSAFYGCYSLTSIEIPSGVTSIGASAFGKCSGLTSIEMPSGVTSIGDVAFYNCSSLTSIEIPSGVTSIGYSAFWGCSGLTSIEIPSGVTSIGDYTFRSCSSLTSVEIPSGVTSIGNYTFYDCSSLTSVEIPSGVTSIGEYTFYNCSSLTSISIPAGVTGIGTFAFGDCSSLTSVEIPSSLTNIGNYAFYNCSSLTNIEIPSGVTSIGIQAFSYCSGLTSIEISNGMTSIGVRAFIGCSSLDSINIPSGVTSIGDSAFEDCSGLTSIEIPNSVTSVGQNAFSGCSGLTIYCEAESKPSGWNSKWNPDNRPVTWNYLEILIASFDYVIDDGKVTITRYRGNKEAVKIPSKVKDYPVVAIGDQAFFGCSILTDIDIPSSVTSIGDRAFSGCNRLTSVDIPSGVTSIGEGSFSSCMSLTNVNIPSGVTSIGDNAFSGCGRLTSVDIPSSVTSIGDRAFSNCMSLTGIDIPSGVTSIGQGAFNHCSGLTSIELPSGLTSIGKDAFSSCSRLTSIEIPSSVTSIGQSAFSFCSGLTSIEIPSSVTSMGSSVFSNCSSLTVIYCEAESQPSGWDSKWNSSNIQVVWNCNGHGVTEGLKWGLQTDGTIMITGYSGTSTQVMIPATIDGREVTTIYDNAFSGNDSLTSIEIPSGVTRVGNSAFADCSSLQFNEYEDGLYLGNKENRYLVLVKLKDSAITSCKINEKVKIICNNTFYSCSNLTSINIPNGVTSIGDSAFYGCSNLTSINIPSGVTRIGDNTFYECSSLDSINIPTGVTSIGDSAFYGCSSLTGNIVIPSGVTSIGEYTFRSCRGLTSIEIPSSVTSIGNHAFESCSGLTSIELPSGLTSIGDYAFSGCSRLISVDIPNSVTSMGNYVFSNCSSLTSLEMPISITSIGHYTFSGCINLTSIEIPSGVTSIGQNTFYGCRSLTSIEIPSSVTSIGNGAFYGCNGLTIYCEASSQPSGWSNSWNNSNRPVVWGYKNQI